MSEEEANTIYEAKPVSFKQFMAELLSQQPGQSIYVITDEPFDHDCNGVRAFV